MSSEGHRSLLLKLSTWLTICCWAFVGLAQSTQTDDKSAPTPIRDTAAIQVLQRALSALGGSQRAAGVTSIRVTGVLNFTDGVAQPFVWEDLFTGKFHEMRRERTDGGLRQILVSGHGKPSVTQGGKSKPIYAHVVAASHTLHCPALAIFEALSDPRFSVELASTTDSKLVHVRTVNRSSKADAAISELNWFFDLQSGLPVGVESHIPFVKNALQYKSSLHQFGKFKDVGGLLMPQEISIKGPDGKVGLFSITTISINAPLSSSEFEAEGGAE